MKQIADFLDANPEWYPVFDDEMRVTALTSPQFPFPPIAVVDTRFTLYGRSIAPELLEMQRRNQMFDQDIIDRLHRGQL